MTNAGNFSEAGNFSKPSISLHAFFRAGEYIRSRRLAAMMSLRKAASLVGVSHVFLGEVERGAKALPASRCGAVAKAIPGVDVEVLRAAAGVEPGPQCIGCGDIITPGDMNATGCTLTVDGWTCGTCIDTCAVSLPDMREAQP